MSRLNQLSRLRGALRPRDQVKVTISAGVVAEHRAHLSALGYGLKGRLGVGRDGELVALDEQAQEELFMLATALKDLLGQQATETLEERSRFTWEAFVGHCLRWWFVSGGGRPLMRALQERLSDHAIILEVAWAEGLQADRLPAPASQTPLWIGGVAGLAVSQEFWWAPWPIAVTLGLMVGWLSMRPRWRCAVRAVCYDLALI